MRKAIRDKEGLSFKDIGEQLGLNKDTVRKYYDEEKLEGVENEKEIR